MAFVTKRCSRCQRLASTVAKVVKGRLRWLCPLCRGPEPRMPPKSTVEKA